MYPLDLSQTSSSLHRLSKNAFSEQILLKRNAWLKGIDFLEWKTWQELACKYWCVSILMYVYVCIFSFLNILSHSFYDSLVCGDFLLRPVHILVWTFFIYCFLFFMVAWIVFAICFTFCKSFVRFSNLYPVHFCHIF